MNASSINYEAPIAIVIDFSSDETGDAKNASVTALTTR